MSAAVFTANPLRPRPLFPPLDAPAHVLAAAAEKKATEYAKQLLANSLTREMATAILRDNKHLLSPQALEAKKVFTRFMLYQQTNNIKHRCASNVYFVLRMFRAFGIWSFRAKALFALVIGPEGQVFECIAHLALISEYEEVLDPSYDVFSREGVQYVGDMKELLEVLPSARTQFAKEGFAQYLELAKFANFLNVATGLPKGTNDQLLEDPYLDQVEVALEQGNAKGISV